MRTAVNYGVGDNRLDLDVDVVINATPVGGERSPWPSDAPLSARVVFDTAIAAGPSRFRRLAKLALFLLVVGIGVHIASPPRYEFPPAVPFSGDYTEGMEEKSIPTYDRYLAKRRQWEAEEAENIRALIEARGSN